MSSSGRSKWLFKQEAREERKVANEVYCISFADCLRNNGLDLEYPSMEKGKFGDVIMVRGQDIVNARTWKKFLSKSGRNDKDLTSLIDNTEILTEAYDAWLATEHTPRYRALDSDGSEWRLDVVRLSVKFHIIENKLEAYAKGDDEAFSDDWAPILCSLMKIIRTDMKAISELTSHIVKDPELRQSLIAEHFEELRKTFKHTIQRAILRSPEYQELSDLIDRATSFYIAEQTGTQEKEKPEEQEEGGIA